MDNSLHRIHISLLIESEYKKRGVFPMLRFETGKLRGASLHFFNIPFDTIRRIKEDADEQYKISSRSLKTAYGAIVSQMQTILRWPEIEKENRRLEAEARKKFKDDAIEGVAHILGWARMRLWKDEGYRFDNETITDVESAIGKLEDILREGCVVHPNDDEIPAPVETLPDTKSNAALQTFLKSATSDLSLVKNESQEGA